MNLNNSNNTQKVDALYQNFIKKTINYSLFAFKLSNHSKFEPLNLISINLRWQIYGAKLFLRLKLDRLF